MSADAVDDAGNLFDFEPEFEMDVDFVDYLERLAENETAATSAVAEIEVRKQDAVWKDRKPSYPEVQQQP